MRTSDLGETWRGFLRLSASDRREFIGQMKAWHLKRRAVLVAARGGGVLHRGAKDFSDLSLTDADLAPREMEPRTLEDALSLDGW
jgi:hypothetical protein